LLAYILVGMLVPCAELGHPGVKRFYMFMQHRETIKIRREVKLLPQEKWSNDPFMLTTHLTNVRREDDRNTRQMRELSDGIAEAVPAGLLVFNCALWRAFGTGTFAQKVGFVTDWCSSTQEHVVNVALQHWRLGGHCFTDAYYPAKFGFYK